MKTNINSYVMHVAHTIARETPLPWSNAVRLAWGAKTLREALSNGVLVFTFIKSDGTRREAVGTTNTLLIPIDKRPKGVIGHEPNYGAIPFFDLELGEWRSFRVLNFEIFDTAYILHEYLP